MVPSHRRALRARRLSFRHIDGIYQNVLHATFGDIEDKVATGGTPAAAATLVLS
jgi:hypothetical protein